MACFSRSFRGILSLLTLLFLFLLAAPVSAQGLFGVGLPGFPSFGSLSGGTSSGCGEKLCPKGGMEAYIGYMEDREGTTISVDRDGPTPGLTHVRHRFPNRGVWFGLAGSTCLWENLSFVGSGWLLAPSSISSRKDHEFSVGPPLTARSWDVDPQWWFVDGLFAWRVPAGLSLLAGLRYDYFAQNFKDPSDVVLHPSLPSDTSDYTSQAWIPLLGTQYSISGAMGNLVVRAVGFPTILGRFTYKETQVGAVRFEAGGNYDSGYFLEVFAEYSKRFGPGMVGVFGRWNAANAQSTVDSDRLVLGIGVTNSSPRVTMHWHSWTLGGSFGLDFSSPL